MAIQKARPSTLQLIVLFVLTHVFAVNAQIYPDTLWVSVTFYDFHADGSNPEFEPCPYNWPPSLSSDGHVTGMVATTLDAERKPVKGTRTYFNEYMKYWFRPYADSADGDYTKPQYDGDGQLTGIADTDHDTAFTNMVFQDSLPFILIDASNGTYQYDNQAFFPLDGRGFGAEPADPPCASWFDQSTHYHNYSFTMEIHREFVYRQGSTFYFRGDDDVWVFINDSLVMDIGGIHGPVDGQLNLDNLNLVEGETYDIDFFYCERHVSGSDILITSNVITAEPSELHIQVEPDDTIQAADTAWASALVLDQSNDTINDLPGTFHWGFIDELGTEGNADSTFDTLSDTLVRFVPTEAYTTVRIWGSYIDTDQGISIDDTATIVIAPGDPDHVVIESSPTRPGGTDPALRNDNPRPSVSIASDQTSDDQLYAILRDRYGNWCQEDSVYANPATWTSDNTGIVTAAAGSSPELGQGEVSRVEAGTTTVRATSPQGFTDDIPVTVVAYTITAVRIVVQHGSNKVPIPELTMSVDEDTTLLAQGKNSATLEWEPVSVDWSTSGVATVGAPPTGLEFWEMLQPAASGTGTITITYSGATALTASISATFLKGAPRSLVLYQSAGQPGGGNDPLPSTTITHTAGQPFDLYAKIFDNTPEWLSVYESDPDSAELITWNVCDESDATWTGSYLNRSRGSTVSFTPLRAWHTYKVTATFRSSFSDTALFRVVAANAAALYIEGSSQRTHSPNVPAPSDTVRLGSRDTARTVYAIVRDTYGNYVKPSNPTGWNTDDTTIVKASTGAVASNGEGVIRRNGVSGRTFVSATDGVNSSLSDSVPVVLDAYTYDSLRIVVQAGTERRDISALEMRTDQDTTLLALGLRSDNGGWEAARVNWSISGAEATPLPPADSSSWSFSPNSAATGTIRIDRSGVSDQVAVEFLPGLPASAAIYDREGDPSSLAPYPDTTTAVQVTAGQAIPLVAKMFDSNSPPVWLSQYETTSLSSRISWTVDDETAGTFGSTQGHTTAFTPTKAYTAVIVTATYTNGSDTTYTDRVKLRIEPGFAAQLSIEASPANVSPNTPVPMGTITLNSRDTTRSAYAVLRDQHGNYIGPSNPTVWASADTTVVKVAAGFAINGEGVVRRNGVSGTTTVSATDESTGLSATVDVVLEPYTIDSLRIVIQTGTEQSDIESLTMRTDQDTTLLALGLRSDKGEWEAVEVDWSTIDVNATPTAPGNRESWKFSPDAPGSGTIRIDLGEIHDQLSVQFLPGLPASLDIYDQEGDPLSLNLSPYPDTAIQVQAGTPVPLVSKIFDHNGVWLSAYENDVAKSNSITWSASDNTAGTFTVTQGHRTSFTPTKAYTSVTIAAAYSEGATTLWTTLRLYITPGPAAQLVIEASPENVSPNEPAPMGTVTLNSRDTTRSAYAVLRDTYGNYIEPSNPTDWASLDTTVVTVHPGFAVNGEGTVRRNGLSGTTVVNATDRGTSLSAGVDVVLEPYTIDSLRIVVQVGIEQRDIGELTMRTDQDTVLLVLGLRSDNGAWVPVDADWSISGVGATPSAPGNANSWAFSPNQAGTGTIQVAMGYVVDKISLTALTGLPRDLEIYDRGGDPVDQALVPYPDTAITVQAGDTLPLVAKIFDHNGVWLSGYETDPGKSASIGWGLDDTSAGTLNGPLTGAHTSFVPTKAYVNATITATYTDADTSFFDRVRIRIQPGPATQLSIEANPEQSYSPNASRSLGTLTLNSRDTTGSAYAIMRDRYGNYIDPSNPTTWSSRDTGIVTVRPGFTVNGEGVVRRTGVSGETVITATDDSTSLSATATVVLQAYTIDSLMIVVQHDDSLVGIEDLTMRTDQDTSILVLGLRSDNAEWIPVPADWASPGLQLEPSAPAADSVWRFSPREPGNGAIVVSNTVASDTLPVVFNPGLPHHLVLYDSEGRPTENTRYPDSRVTVRAGDSLRVVAKVFDRFDYWLSEYETNASKAARISWAVEEQLGTSDATGALTGSGSRITYTPRVAFRDVDIVATFTPQGPGLPFSDTLRLSVEPGGPYRVVIEAAANSGESSPTTDNPVDTVRITATDTVQSVYLIVRDRFGNYIRNSTQVQWTSLNTHVALAAAGSRAIGEGIVSRVDSGFAVVTGADFADTNLVVEIDSVVVDVVNYHYTGLRILTGSGGSIDSLTMNTNQDTTLRVQGLRSDGKGWEDVSAQWELADSLVVAPPPSSGHEWRFSPSEPGGGWLRAYLNSEGTAPDTVWVAFSVGPPVKTTFTVLTPPDSLIAGEPITTEVQIFNTNGLVPGSWCGQVVFSDMLELDTARGTPRVIITTADGDLDTVDMETAVELCFHDGVAAVDFLLYNAPSTREPHHLTIELNDSLSDTTQPFILLPGPLAQLVLERYDGTSVGDSLYMAYPDSSVVIFARGYDRFGNERGDQKSNWTTDGTLHPISRSDGVSRIYYTAAEVADNEQGFIRAVALDTSNGAVTDSVFARIAGPLIGLDRSITRDLDGDGLLDAVELYFTKPFAMPADSLIRDSIMVVHDQSGIRFAVGSIVADSTFDSVYVVHLAEDSTEGPQTAWTPYVALSGIEGVSRIPAQTHYAIDGAGPVVWRVIKSIKAPEDRSQDRVRVVFSETILSADGTTLALETMPESLFHVYERGLDGTYDSVPGVFAGIGNLAAVVSDSIVEFVMSNGNDLRSRQYVNIRGTELITDQSGQDNAPNEDNRKVRVEIVGPPPAAVQSFPNPTRPTFRREAPGTFRAVHQPLARRWALDDRSGTVLTMAVPVPDIDEPQRIEVFIKIYDMVGNLVHEAENPDLVAGLPRDGGSVQSVDFYWNGSNEEGMPVAPGVYRVVVYLDYASREHEDTRLLTNVGIGK